MKTVFYIGAVAEIRFNEKFSIQPEVVYSTQGAKVSSAMISTGTVVAKWNSDYINILVLAKYYIYC